jgi:hypothetical protein
LLERIGKDMSWMTDLPVEFVQFSKVNDCTISETVSRGDLRASVHRDRNSLNQITTVL